MSQLPCLLTWQEERGEAMEVIIAFREERSSLQNLLDEGRVMRHLRHQQEPVDDDEEENSYYATAVREEDEEYFEATDSGQHQQDRGVLAMEETPDCHETEKQLKEFSNFFLRKIKEMVEKKRSEVRS